MAEPSSEVTVIDGIAAAASIRIDHWGIAHIRAESLDDLYFLQGFNAARDRLWQIDLWRKRGLGLLSADFGPGYLEQDRAARHLLYRGEMDREWASYDGDARRTCERFVAGINAYIALCGTEPERLPPEFTEMGTRPARWRAEDVVRIRSHAILRNAPSELARANILAATGDDTDLVRQDLQPLVDPGECMGPIDVRALDMLRLATATVSFHPDRLAATLDDAGLWTKLAVDGAIEQQTQGEGSNNWAVDGRHTDTGRPIMGTDPHRAPGQPSLRYIVHLSSPEFDGIGAGEPAIPGISMGHNGSAAFSFTLFTGADQEDLYLYETKPDAPHFYRYGDGWEAMEIVEEAVQLRDGAHATLTLKFTRHGPVLAEYPEQGRAIGMRTVMLEPGAAPYFQAIASMRARSFGEFRQAMGRWRLPAVNQLYADTGGTIGWAVAGAMPVRPGWTGLLPVAGDGRHEWAGMIDPDVLPHSVNPDSGYLASANEYNLPPGWHLDHPLPGYEWAHSARAERIAEVLAKSAPHSLSTSAALQNDLLSITARRVCALLGEPTADPTAERPRAALRGWDCWLGPNSAAAALFEVWMTRFLRPALIERLVVDPRMRALVGPGSLNVVLDMLENRLAPSERTALFDRTLSDAWAWCERRLGPDPALWAWGSLHRAEFIHPLSGLSPSGRSSRDIGPIPVGGSESTPLNGFYRPQDFGLNFFATVRLVLDVGNWDRSLAVNCPGQSGDPRSPHYADLAPLWAKGEYFPLLYSPAAVAAATRHIIKIAPNDRS